MIYVTVGTMFMDFPRLINAMDAIAADTGERVVIQTGMGNTVPKHAEHFDFKSHDGVLALQAESRLIVSHAGIGCVLDALEVHKPLIVMPRRHELNEHMDDHQVQIAEAVQARGWGRMILDVAELPEACANPPAVPEAYHSSAHRLVWAVRDRVDRIAARKARP